MRKICPTLLRGDQLQSEEETIPEIDPTLDLVTAAGTAMTIAATPRALLHRGAADQRTGTAIARATAPPDTAAGAEATVAAAVAAPAEAGIRITGKRVGR